TRSDVITLKSNIIAFESYIYFFFQAEDGIRDKLVTGVQTCALPIYVFKISTALKTFKSVKRRLEVRAEVNGITIIDDFAHHPTAIAGTLTALRSRYPRGRIWAILEPRSNTLRRNVLQNDLARSLAMADEVVIANVFKSDAIPEAERLDLVALATQIQAHGRRARIVPEVDGIVQLIVPEMRPGDVAAILSNGGFGGIYEKLPQRLRMLAGSVASNSAEARAKALSD